MARRELIGIQQIQHGHVEVTEEQIRHRRRQHAYALQHVVEVRLGDASAAREASFRIHHAAHAGERSQSAGAGATRKYMVCANEMIPLEIGATRFRS